MPLACANHPKVRAGFTCFDCHGPICEECIRTRDDGLIVCPACFAGEIPLADEPRGGMEPAAAQEPAGPPAYPCMGHPEVPAVIGCSVCRGLVCATCDFVFDDLHLCPRCAVLAGEAMTPQRKKMALWSMGLGFAVIAAIGIMALLFFTSSGADESVRIGLIFFALALGVLSLGSSVMGFLLGIYSIERKSVNPWYVWFGTVANGIVAAFCCLAVLARVVTLAMG